MFVCLECGEFFDETEIGNTTENRGYYGDEKCFVNVSCCPVCAGAYTEAEQCKICGEYHSTDDLTGGVCEECLDDYRRDFDTCYRISIGEKTNIKINSLLASLLDVSDIEQILIEHIRDRWHDVDCSQFIDSDISWFGERLAEEANESENSKK